MNPITKGLQKHSGNADHKCVRDNGSLRTELADTALSADAIKHLLSVCQIKQSMVDMEIHHSHPRLGH